MDLPVYIDKRVGDSEFFAVSLTVRCLILHSRELGFKTHPDANPLVLIVALDRAGSVSSRQRGCHPRHERHGGPSTHKYFPYSLLIYLHSGDLSCVRLMLPLLTRFGISHLDIIVATHVIVCILQPFLVHSPLTSTSLLNGHLPRMAASQFFTP